MQVAPGEYTLSTVASLDKDRADSIVQLVLQPDLAAGVLQTPKLSVVGGSRIGQVSGQVAWCGLAQQVCKGVMGKICLIQRGELRPAEQQMEQTRGRDSAAALWGACSAEASVLTRSFRSWPAQS